MYHQLRATLGTALALCGGLLAAGSHAADAASDSDAALETIVITGSLLPHRSGDETSPVLTITAQEMQANGFRTVAEAVQHTSFATGAVAGPQQVGSYTPGVQVVSLFGLSPGYTKYLIDGRPMADYPALYGGADVVVSLSGIPEAFVDHIDVLPGGQSSLYGSDAIAGVINVVMKKSLDHPVVNLRYTAYQEGGGVNRHIDLANGFQRGALSLMAGVQLEQSQPIWGYQRPLTSTHFAAGTTPADATSVYLVWGLFGGPTGDFYLPDPTHCANVSAGFRGTVREFQRPGDGPYCGTASAGYDIIANGGHSAQLFLRATLSASEHDEWYADALLDHERAGYSYGPSFYSTYFNQGYFYDPSLDDLVVMQRRFTPEEAGAADPYPGRVIANAPSATLGRRGSWGKAWSYDASVSRSEMRLVKLTHVLFTQKVNDFFAAFLGPDLGPDPITGSFATYNPDYASFFRPLTPQQYASFSGFGHSYSRTAANLFRLQLSNSNLLQLPGGASGLAWVLEGGNQQWSFRPDPEYLTGDYYLISANSGRGGRSRIGSAIEWQVPLLKSLQATASVRYDRYHVYRNHIAHATQALSADWHPTESLHVRGHSGTSFKMATIPDQFQGTSGRNTDLTDYYQCGLAGYTGTTLEQCPYFDVPLLATTSGNPALKPITANVSDIGVVWQPTHAWRLSADLFRWTLRNEVATLDADQIMKTEGACRLGTLDPASPTCVAALSDVTRDAQGFLQALYIPKVNVSRESVKAVSVDTDLSWSWRSAQWHLHAGWTDMLSHEYRQFDNDAMLDLFQTPTYSTDFKSRANASLDVARGSSAATLYVSYDGRTPNNLAQIYGFGTPGAGLLGRWTLCNLSLKHEFTPTWTAFLAINNLFNTMPPVDRSYGGRDDSPYNSVVYSVYGRSYTLTVGYAPKSGTH